MIHMFEGIDEKHAALLPTRHWLKYFRLPHRAFVCLSLLLGICLRPVNPSRRLVTGFKSSGGRGLAVIDGSLEAQWKFKQSLTTNETPCSIRRAADLTAKLKPSSGLLIFLFRY